MAATKHALPENEANGDIDHRPHKKLKVKSGGGGDPTSGENKDKRRKQQDKKHGDRGEEGIKKERGEKKKKKKKRDENGTKDDSAETLREDAEQQPKKSKGSKKNRADAQNLGQNSMPAQFQRGRPYRQPYSLTSLPQSDIDAFTKVNAITITDPKSQSPALRPILEFSQLPNTTLLKKSPFSAFRIPTPIQSASWPFTLSGRDVIGVAETGSGKTMAFALPCVEVVSESKHNGPKAVIVSPTRELAMQTHAQMASLASLVSLDCVCLFGGASKTTQKALLDQGVDIIVATPGRLKDFMADGTVDLSCAQFVVLDEADRMLDKGFEDDIRHILSSAPPREQRQTLMFTATWPASVQELASSFMVDPVKITIGSGGKETANGAVELQANARISQKVEVIDQRDKESRLLQILKQHQQGKRRNDRILVFCLYKKEATRIEIFLRQRDIRVASIHGDLRQEQRTKSLEAFKTGQTSVLVATDVAARGLDIPEVKLVINVTFPLTIEDYVHRIGRTGRAGKAGEAITLFTEQEKALSGSLINILKSANQQVPDELLKFGTTVKKKEHSTYGAFFKDVDMTKKAIKITFDD